MQNFSLMPGVDNYAVFGNPVAHSKSPKIHAAFATQTGQAVHYQAIRVELNEFRQTLDAFQQAGGRGLNITLPFKEEAWRCADHLTDRARRAGAVNTLWFDQEGKRHGDTTDGAGLICDLTVNHGLTLTGQDILVLGAGGAVRGIIDPVFDQQPAHIVIANRTPARASDLARLFSDRGEVHACDYSGLRGRKFHLVINGTSASLQGTLPPLPEDILSPGAVCYDMMYDSSDTIFMSWAKVHGAVRALDGLGMLVEQAAESFRIWRGVRPLTIPVIEMLRAAI